MATPAFPLPPPIGLLRQVGVHEIGSPIPLSRSSSVGSQEVSYENPDDMMRRRLLTYKTYLEHEIDFIGNEITAIIERVPGDNAHDTQVLEELKDSLKIRYNTLQKRYIRVKDLLEAM